MKIYKQRNKVMGGAEGSAAVMDKENSEKNETIEKKKHRTYLREFSEDHTQFHGYQ